MPDSVPPPPRHPLLPRKTVCCRAQRRSLDGPGRVKTANFQLLSRQLPHQTSEGREDSEPPSTWAAFRCSYSQAPPTRFLDAEFSHGLDPKRTYRQRCQCRLRPASGLSCDAVAISDRCVGGGLLQRQKATLRRRAVMSVGSRAPRAGLTYWTSAVSLAQGVRPRLCHASMPFSSLKSSTGSRLSCSPSETLKAKAPMPKRS